MTKIRPIAQRVRSTIEGVRFGGPKGELSIAQYAELYPHRWRQVAAASDRKLGQPTCLGWKPAEFEALTPSPELGVLSVPDGFIVGYHGWVFTSAGKFLKDCAWPTRGGDPRGKPEHFHHIRHLHGTCLNIASDWSGHNYAHFLFDSLGRLGLVEAAGVKWDEIDFIYAPRPDSELTLGLMERLNVPLQKCIWASDDIHIRADKVIATTFPGSRFDYPRLSLDFLHRARDTRSDGARRIFVPRGQIRNISNEAEILDVVKDFGFTVYDCTRDAGFRAFSNAEIIVGPHGAGLSNAVFCPPEAQVVDLIPSDMTLPFFHAKCEAMGQSYGYIVGQSEGEREEGFFGPSPFNFRIEPEELRSALETLLR